MTTNPRLKPPCCQATQDAIRCSSDEELDICPYPSGSAAKVFLMQIRNERYEGTGKFANKPATDDNARIIFRENDNPATIYPAATLGTGTQSVRPMIIQSTIQEPQ